MASYHSKLNCYKDEKQRPSTFLFRIAVVRSIPPCFARWTSVPDSYEVPLVCAPGIPQLVCPTLLVVGHITLFVKTPLSYEVCRNKIGEI